MIATREQRTRLGVIEALSRGFDLIGRLPWIIGLPILLDLFLWRGPQLSLAPLVDRLLSVYGRLIAQRGLVDLGAPAPETLDGIRETLTALNVFVALAMNLVAIPSSAQTRPSAGPVFFTVEQPLVALSVFVGLEIIGMALGCFYFGVLAQGVRGERTDLVHLLASVPRFWVRLMAVLVALLALPVVVGLPAGLLLAGLGLVNPAAAQAIGLFMLVVAQVGAVWLAIYLFFVIDAVILSDVGPRAAVGHSVTVVARNFWPALGFIGLSFVIAQGMFQVWHWLSQSNVGNVVAMLGHAYVASGLAAASMAFYWSRVQHEQTT